MRKLKILVWISCLILLILFLQEEAISIETEEDIFGLNLVRSLGETLKSERK